MIYTLTLCFILLLTPIISHAHGLKVHVSEFSNLESIEAMDLDASAQLKIEKLIPRIYRRFCHLTVRPDAVIISVELVQIEWSLQRICQQSFPNDAIL
ncbi:MAG: hypothetical protein H0V66_13815 [Bdellovibrionales bacterium]|nr:hypothetical protein [Bdellovibrionales bacterium]